MKFNCVAHQSHGRLASRRQKPQESASVAPSEMRQGGDLGATRTCRRHNDRGPPYKNRQPPTHLSARPRLPRLLPMQHLKGHPETSQEGERNQQRPRRGDHRRDTWAGRGQAEEFEESTGVPMGQPRPGPKVEPRAQGGPQRGGPCRGRPVRARPSHRHQPSDGEKPISALP